MNTPGSDTGAIPVALPEIRCPARRVVGARSLNFSRT